MIAVIVYCYHLSDLTYDSSVMGTHSHLTTLREARYDALLRDANHFRISAVDRFTHADRT